MLAIYIGQMSDWVNPIKCAFISSIDLICNAPNYTIQAPIKVFLMVRNCSDNICLVHAVVAFPGFNWYSELGQKQFIISTMIPNIFRANNPRQKRMPMTSVQAEVQKMCAVSSGSVGNSTKCSILLPDKPRSAAPQAISDLLLPDKQTDRHHVRLAVCLCVFSGFPVRDPDECLGQLT